MFYKSRLSMNCAIFAMLVDISYICHRAGLCENGDICKKVRENTTKIEQAFIPPELQLKYTL